MAAKINWHRWDKITLLPPYVYGSVVGDIAPPPESESEADFRLQAKIS